MALFQLRYLPNAPLVLKDVTFSVNGGEKLGVVGRTGSGKSSLVLALFRIVEPAAGKIIIDGIDINIVGLNDLRSKLNIIPQEPTLFEGTIRDNLDPLCLHTDQEIWEVCSNHWFF
jgi:ATP-binding cassette subfamily C (CFTR/MRP) protein 2